MILVSGLLALTTGIYGVQDPQLMVDLYAQVGLTMSTDLIIPLGYIQVLFGLVAILGGMAAMWGARYWGLATTGGFLGFLASGALFLGTILGLIGLVLIVAARKEFRN